MRTLPVRSFTDHRGTLSVLEEGEVPFPIERVFWFTKCSQPRGGTHPAKGHYLVVAQAGAVSVTTNNTKGVRLQARKSHAVFIEEGSKVTLDNFTEDAMVLVLSSKPYE